MCRSTNRQVEPEVWFRVVHLGQDGYKGTPVAYCREKMLEISLGPKGVFENGNIGALRLREPLGRRMRAAPPSRGGEADCVRRPPVHSSAVGIARCGLRYSPQP